MDIDKMRRPNSQYIDTNIHQRQAWELNMNSLVKKAKWFSGKRVNETLSGFCDV